MNSDSYVAASRKEAQASSWWSTIAQLAATDFVQQVGGGAREMVDA